MQKSSKKLQNYKLSEAFVQCDFTDGFKYIDRAGEILNLFVREKKAVPKFQMGLGGLIIRDVTENIKELRVSSNTIWVHFVEPKNLGDISNSASSHIENILKILKPTIYRRMGWRTYLVREFGTGSDRDIGDYLSISDQITKHQFQNLVVSTKVSGFNARIELATAKKIDDDTEAALLFDIDISKEITSKPTVKNVLEQIRTQLRSDELLDGLEGLIKNE